MQQLGAIVVGLGAMGSATLYHLAKRGAQVLGLEAQPAVAHSMGSSHGLTRIIRLAYFEHPAYVPLLQRSYALWRDLEAESGKDILKTTGCLDCAPPARQASVGTLQGQLTCFEGSLLAAKQHGLVHEVLTGKQANARFPGYCLPEDFQVLYQPEGGYLVPERGIEAHVAAAQQHGAQVACGTRVLGWEPAAAAGSEGAAGVVVHTEGPGGKRASYWAKKLVMTPGAWLDKLVPEMQGLLQVERQVVGWFEVEEGRAGDFTPSNFPVFLLQDRNGYYYGFPADAHGFKLGRYHHMREVVDPDNVPRDITQADEQVLRECVDNYFPGAAGKMTRASACMFTNTPDGHFILDLHPRHPQVVLASACSGHGYKFASVVGEILAQLALEGRTQHDIGFLRLDADRKGHAEFLRRCSGPSRSSL